MHPNHRNEVIYRLAIDELHKNNVTDFIKLPQIAVMGDTSSGKSSLLTAISHIHLPSNDKITTRCPLLLRMEKNDIVTAKIDISWHSSSQYKPSVEDNWKPRTLTTWDEIPEAISDAQTFILECANKAVARDVIMLSVAGPECTDLTLIDLPGIIRSVGKDEDTGMIEDIQQLIDEYLCNERCIILAVVPANVDFHNSEILSSAEKVDPSTSRTIPVITKPDLIDPGAESAVSELLLGRVKEFKMGFHMVKCRGQKALDDAVSLETFLSKEMEYFDAHTTWKKVGDRQLFGVSSLRNKLADVQVQMIDTSLPSIIKEVAEKKRNAENRLKKLGDSLQTDAERRAYFNTALEEALHILEKTLVGEHLGKKTKSLINKDGCTWCASKQNEYNSFGCNVESTKLANISTIAVGDVVFATIGTVEVEATVITKDADNSVQLVALNANEDNYFHRNNDRKSFPPDSYRKSNTWIKDMIARNKSNDLPCFPSTALFRSIITNIIREDIQPLCTGLLEAGKEHLQEVTTFAFLRILKNKFTFLNNFIENKLNILVDEINVAAAENVEQYLLKEETPYTQDRYLYKIISKKRMEPPNRRLKAALAPPLYGKAPVASPSNTNTIIDESMSAEDYCANELENIVDAYGKVAAKRIIDGIPMILDAELFTPLVDTLRRSLQMTDEELSSTLVESQSSLSERERLLREIGTMEAADKVFANLRTLVRVTF